MSRRLGLPAAQDLLGRSATACLTLALVLGGCAVRRTATPSPRRPAASPDAAAPDTAGARGALSREVARERARRISDLHYDLDLDLSGPGDGFGGTVTIEFRLDAADTGVRLDFGGGAVDSVAANGEAIQALYDGHWLLVPAAALRAGDNALRIDFRQTYRGDGTGLHRFVDPEDGRTYLYTYLWPYYANQVFPLFDQPDLKAVFELSVKAPADWVVVSTAPGEVRERTDTTASWSFQPTKRISSYVFSLHAGPYRVWESTAGDIPLRLMARQTLADYVAVDEWFDVTRRGLEHYQSYYGIPYPFGKYDQLIVPDFQIGAMENVAAVTFGEHYVQRQASSFAERERRASVILHEMAHMWFGDLVTHRWWNGLWLNESFATQMSAIAMADATEFDDTWLGFFIGEKQAAYWKDSRVTSHPIEMPIAATDEFFSVFDAITYQKGSSVLKQLAYRVGAESYRAGVSAYLERHAFGNTELEDFTRSIARAAGEDLEPWSAEWLHQPGFNVVRTRPVCEAGRLRTVEIEQRAESVGPPARSHASRVAFYGLDDQDRLSRTAVLDARFEGEHTTLPIAEAIPCPVLIWPNHEDWGYFRVELSPSELEVVRTHLLEVDDPFARSMLFQAYSDAAQRGDVPFRDTFDLARSLLAADEELRLITQVTSSLRDSITLLERLAPESDDLLASVRPGLETMAWEHLSDRPGSDLQRLWLDFFVAVAATDEGLDRFRGLLDGELQIPEIEISDDLRWRLLQGLARRGAEDVPRRLAAQRERDPSDYGEKMAIAVEAAQPDLEAKRHWIAIASRPEHPMGLAKQRMAMNALFPPNQSALAAALLPQVLETLAAFDPGVDPYYAARFSQGLLVPLCTEEGAALYASALEARESLASAARLFLREAAQANEECLSLRERAATDPF